MKYATKLLLFSLFLVIIGCSSSKPGNNTPKVIKPRFEKEIQSGQMGKADIVKDELVNIDFWPYVLNREILKADMQGGKPWIYGSCSSFLLGKDKSYDIISEFIIDKKGVPQDIRFNDDLGSCKEIISKRLKKLRFTPGTIDDIRIPTLVTYPINMGSFFKF